MRRRSPGTTAGCAVLTRTDRCARRLCPRFVLRADDWADAVEQGRQVAHAGLVEQNLPGLSVAVGVGGDIVWAEDFGRADLDNRVPFEPPTRFRIGTASVALTSAAVGLLLEKDRLNLDAEIQTHVPAFRRNSGP